MVMDTLALAVSASANYFLRHKEAQRMMLPLVAFPICGLLDLFCIYYELKAVQLRSLNRERAEMVAQHWLEHGKVGTDCSSSNSSLSDCVRHVVYSTGLRSRCKSFYGAEEVGSGLWHWCAHVLQPLMK
jgi:hypothetical protein